MALTLGRGPFSKRSSAEVNFEISGPRHLLPFEDYPRRMRALLGGETVVDSERGSCSTRAGSHPCCICPRRTWRPG